MRALATPSIALALVLAALPARADDDARRQRPAGASGVEGTHGRLDGDLSVAAGVGATFGPRAPRATADVRLRYLWTAGLFGTYEDGPVLGASSDPRRVLAAGVELRPLFLARWLTGRETGSPYLDLTLDSLGFELGAVFLQPVGASFASRPGLQAGFGVELPIFPRATGPIVGVHGGLRWSDAALSGRPIEGPVDRSAYLAITIAWQQVFGAHVVDVGDRAP